MSMKMRRYQETVTDQIVTYETVSQIRTCLRLGLWDLE